MHIHEAARLKAAFLEDRSRSVEAVYQRDAETGDHLWKAHIHRSAPPELSLLVGDAAHNLRSALDHLAWQLCLIGNVAPDQKTGFPIWNRGEANSFKPSGLRGVNTKALKTVRELQPFTTALGARDPLWLLHRIDIIDKHRFLPIVVAETDFVMLPRGDRDLPLSEFSPKFGPDR